MDFHEAGPLCANAPWTTTFNVTSTSAGSSLWSVIKEEHSVFPVKMGEIIGGARRVVYQGGYG